MGVVVSAMDSLRETDQGEFDALSKQVTALQQRLDTVKKAGAEKKAAEAEEETAAAKDKAATKVQTLQRAKTARLEVAKVKKEEAVKDEAAADIQNMVRSSSSFKFSSKKVKEERERKEASKDEAAAEIQMLAKAHEEEAVDAGGAERGGGEGGGGREGGGEGGGGQKVEAATDGLPEVVPLLSPRLQVLGRLYLQQKTTKQFVSYASWPSKGGKRFASYGVAKPAVQVKPQPTKPPTEAAAKHVDGKQRPRQRRRRLVWPAVDP